MFGINLLALNKIRLNTKLLLLGFIQTIAMAIIYAHFSIYLYEVLNFTKSEIGFMVIFFTLIALLSSFILSRFLEIFGDKNIYIFSVLLLILTFISLKFSSSTIFIIILGSSFYMFNYIRETSFNIMFKDEEESDENYQNDEGILLSFNNLGISIAPLIGGFLLYSFKISDLFLFSSGILIIVLFLFSFVNVPVIKKEIEIELEENKNKNKVLINLKSYFKNNQLKNLFIIGFSNKYWWSFLYIFFPLIILENGFDVSFVSVFLSLIILPLVILEFPISKYANKLGIRNIFIVSHLIMIFGLFGAFIFEDIYIKCGFLIFGSIGPAFIEPSKELFFFKNVTKVQEDKFYSIYFSSNNLGGILGKLFLTILFLITNNNSFAYLIVILLLITGLISSIKIKN